MPNRDHLCIRDVCSTSLMRHDHHYLPSSDDARDRSYMWAINESNNRLRYFLLLGNTQSRPSTLYAVATV